MKLDPRLEADSLPVGRMPLCLIRLMRNKAFPWLILVPQRDNIREMHQLFADDQRMLSDEMMGISRALQEMTKADKMNVAALGNMVPQLHIHIIARFEGDAAWPNPVWGWESSEYSAEEAQEMVVQLQKAFAKFPGFALEGHSF